MWLGSVDGRYTFHDAGSTQGTSGGLDGQDNPDRNLREGTNLTGPWESCLNALRTCLPEWKRQAFMRADVV